MSSEKLPKSPKVYNCRVEILHEDVPRYLERGIFIHAGNQLMSNMNDLF